MNPRPASRRAEIVPALLGGLQVLGGLLCILPIFIACNPSSSSTALPPRNADSPRIDSMPQPDFYLGGIQVNEENNSTWLDALEARNMNTISVTDYARHGNWDGDDLVWNDGNPEVVAEVRAAKQRDMHVVMILRVHLETAHERNRFLWHGMILPETDKQLASWFEKYTSFALDWAKVAEEEGVDVLMLGSEMNALASTLPLEKLPELEDYFLSEKKQEERRQELLRHREVIESQQHDVLERQGYDSLEAYLEDRIAIEEDWATTLAGATEAETLERLNHRRQMLQDHWHKLIHRVREVYSGRLGYAANFDQFDHVGFWSQLDVMGINAYFPLRKQVLPNPTEESLYKLLHQGWTIALRQVNHFRQVQGLSEMPVIFSEMGYTYRANSTLQPWADTGHALIRHGHLGDNGYEEKMIVWREESEDFKERALAVRALYDAHQELPQPLLKGILYWKFSTIPSHHEIESFLVRIDEASEDPAIAELQRFAELQ